MKLYLLRYSRRSGSVSISIQLFCRVILRIQLSLRWCDCRKQEWEIRCRASEEFVPFYEYGGQSPFWKAAPDLFEVLIVSRAAWKRKQNKFPIPVDGEPFQQSCIAA